MQPGRYSSAPHAGVRFRFEPIREERLAMLHAWLLRPHVARWWQPTPSLAELREDYLPRVPRPDETRAYIACADERAIGFIQCYVVMGCGGDWWPDETNPGARGIDQFIAESSLLGRGLGSAMIRAFLCELFTDPAVTVVQTDPNPANERAVRSYIRAGFCIVGRVTTPDGPALLMRCERTDAFVQTRESLC